MRPNRRLTRFAAAAVLAAIVPAARAASTATFTADDKGTFPGTLKHDAKSGALTVDLSALGANATVFRAELMLHAGRGRQVFKPTTVYPVEKPDRKLKFAAPRCVGLDALEAVRSAVKAGKPLKLKVEAAAGGVRRLEVSYLQGKPRAASIPKVTSVRAIHRKGQSLIVFAEPKLGDFGDFKTGGEVAKFKAELGKKHPGLAFRIWRGPERITPKTIAKARLIGQCGPLTCWNGSYHQGGTGKSPPLRYRVNDGGDPVPWGTGIYAHNPAAAGRAWYAVTVSVNGEEDLSALDAGNTTAEAVEETTGLGEPILQWIEQPKRWMYRQGPLTRLIYTRWESWGPPENKTPHSSFPSNPIDYLVAIPQGERPKSGGREPQYRAYKADGPAPVGLHLHCWGGSLNGGYGWWYNAHRGAVLIASNQIPYDWWTGYHESRGTAKTLGDGHVQPFSMNRVLGFLDWAVTQHAEAPDACRKHWPRLDLKRVFTAGSSMGGSGAPMYAIRYPGRIAWCNAWVGVHIPAMSPQFTGSYRGSYGPRNDAVTMPDGRTSPWDWFSDVWWLKNHVKAETGLIIASNGKADGVIGWRQAYLFARALQETRRPHIYNWGRGGHGTRTLIGSGFSLDVRTDQSLPAFTHCTLDDDIGTGRSRTKAEVQAERARLAEQAKQAGKDPKRIYVCPTDGVPDGAYNAHLWWETATIVDTPQAWEITAMLKAGAPAPECKADLTPRRLQQFRTPKAAKFSYTVTDVNNDKLLAKGTAAADAYDLLTLKQIPILKAGCRVRIVPAK